MKKLLMGIILSLFSVTPAFAHRGEGMHMEYIYMGIFLIIYMFLAFLFVWILYRILKAIEDLVEHKKSTHK